MTDNTVLAQLRELTGTETDMTANLANASALLKMHLPDINWAGFYLFDGAELVLGPFQGLPACIRIPLGKGVCGTAAERRATIIVPDVHLFPGHIACDAASRSEIVVPLLHGNGTLYGVLDVDSATPNRFTDSDRVFLETFASVLMETLHNPEHGSMQTPGSRLR